MRYHCSTVFFSEKKSRTSNNVWARAISIFCISINPSISYKLFHAILQNSIFINLSTLRYKTTVMEKHWEEFSHSIELGVLFRSYFISKLSLIWMSLCFNVPTIHLHLIRWSSDIISYFLMRLLWQIFCLKYINFRTNFDATCLMLKTLVKTLHEPYNISTSSENYLIEIVIKKKFLTSSTLLR